MQKDVLAELKKTIGAEDVTLHNAGVAGGQTMWQMIVYSKHVRAQIVES